VAPALVSPGHMMLAPESTNLMAPLSVRSLGIMSACQEGAARCCVRGAAGLRAACAHVGVLGAASCGTGTKALQHTLQRPSKHAHTHQRAHLGTGAVCAAWGTSVRPCQSRRGAPR
jgi:hypothetical protein